MGQSITADGNEENNEDALMEISFERRGQLKVFYGGSKLRPEG